VGKIVEVIFMKENLEKSYGFPYKNGFCTNLSFI